MFGIEIPRDPHDIKGLVLDAQLCLSRPERQVVDMVSEALDTLPQASIALLHEGYRQWFLVRNTLETNFYAAPTRPGSRPVPALDDHGVSLVYGRLVAEVSAVDPLTVSYSTPLPPEFVGDSLDTVESKLREEVRYACSIGMTVLALEHLDRPVGLLTIERGFVEVPWPFVPRFFERDIDARVGELFDASVLDSPDAFRHGLEF